MPSERFEMRVPVELLERVDAARGHEPRASFVKRALEGMLAGLLAPRVIVPSEEEVMALGEPRLREPDVVHPNGFVERKRDWPSAQPASKPLGKGVFTPRPKGKT